MLRFRLRVRDDQASRLCRRACVAIGKLNSKSVIGTPNDAALVDASMRGKAHHEFIWDCGRPHASNFRAAIGQIAQDAGANLLAVIDACGRVPFNAEVLSAFASG